MKVFYKPKNSPIFPRFPPSNIFIHQKVILVSFPLVFLHHFSKQVIKIFDYSFSHYKKIFILLFFRLFIFGGINLLHKFCVDLLCSGGKSMKNPVFFF